MTGNIAKNDSMGSTIRQKLSCVLHHLAESPWIAYTGIVLLQVKVMLWIWEYHDLAPGDTSYYYLTVFDWLDEGKGSIVRSPIYTLFLAALHKLLDDPFRVLTAAQLGIAICASLLTLVLLRRLLPNYLAWLVAAWWALLPINFDTAYIVHLFSALFPLGLFVVAAYVPNIYGRGIVLAGLLFTAALVRSEYVLLFMLWLMVLAGHEFYRRRSKDPKTSWGTYLLAYGLPLIVTGLFIGGFYLHAKPGSLAEIRQEMHLKQTENMCQIYAYNRKQQGDPWPGNPWTDCENLLERDFGRPEVTFLQALSLNPRAILGHLWWNIKLIPSGTQLALFDYFTGGPNPDYMPAKRAPLVWLPFLLVAGLCVFALLKYFLVPALKNKGFQQNGFAWLLLGSAALLVVVVMMMQRPRPSYMFPYTVFLMALAGLGLQGVLELLRVKSTVKVLTPVAGILLILLAPAHYDADYVNYYGYQGQPLLESYERLSPFIDPESQVPAVIVTPRGDESLCNYLDKDSCTVIQFKKIFGPRFGFYLNRLGVNWVYLRSAEGKPQLKYDTNQWQIAAQGATPEETWVLLHRQKPKPRQ